jgi:hypothetical protein
MKIVLGSSRLAAYLQGGGHWSWYVQYLLGLRALGHDTFFLELLPKSHRPDIDDRCISVFFARMRRLGFGERCAVLLHDRGRPPLVSDECIYGIGTVSLKEIIRDADVLWNFHGSIPAPLLHDFKWKALLDVDPGLLQVSEALGWNGGIYEHDVLFTVGSKINDRDCEIPKLRDNWQPVFPCVHLPFWRVDPPRGQASITSVTQWNWGDDLPFNGRTLSSSKRDAYLRFLDLPKRCSTSFVLAANIPPNDVTGDRELLSEHRWTLVHPHQCIRTVAEYQRFIRDSIAEFGCAKSVYTALRTGWFSDRSAAYLASGRPVIVEDTGLGDHLPTGIGLLTFTTFDQAAGAVDELLRNYPRHQKAAREIAESYLSTEHVLAKMVDYCGAA